MNITGLPPTLGLWSEVLIIWGAIGDAFSKPHFLALVIGLVVAVGLSTAYAFITIKRIFFGIISERAEKALEGQWILAPIIIVAAVSMLLFFFPSFFIEPLRQFIGML